MEMSKYKWRYPGSKTIKTHSPHEASNVEEMPYMKPQKHKERRAEKSGTALERSVGKLLGWGRADINPCPAE